MSEPTTVVATVHTNTPVGMSFNELVQTADVRVGHSLEKVLAHLVGVPFIITGVTVREGVPLDKKTRQNYTSLEIVIADQVTLDNLVKMGRMSLEQRQLLIPNELIVINDGSTGIQRQIVEYLHVLGEIIVPDGPENGARGECRWDIHRSQWVYRVKPEDEDNPAFAIRLLCPRGLRESTYQWTDTMVDAGATTFYLA